MRHWFSLAFKQTAVRRSLRVGLVAGTILALINYSDRDLANDMAAADWLKLALTYLVPYSVSTYASVAEMTSGGNRNGPPSPWPPPPGEGTTSPAACSGVGS